MLFDPRSLAYSSPWPFPSSIEYPKWSRIYQYSYNPFLKREGRNWNLDEPFLSSSTPSSSSTTPYLYSQYSRGLILVLFYRIPNYPIESYGPLVVGIYSLASTRGYPRNQGFHPRQSYHTSSLAPQSLSPFTPPYQQFKLILDWYRKYPISDYQHT